MKDKKTIIRYSKLRVSKLLNDIEEKVNENILKAINSGAISNSSEFLDDNNLLPMAFLEEEFKDYKIQTLEYREEAKSIIQKTG